MHIKVLHILMKCLPWFQLTLILYEFRYVVWLTSSCPLSNASWGGFCCLNLVMYIWLKWRCVGGWLVGWVVHRNEHKSCCRICFEAHNFWPALMRAPNIERRRSCRRCESQISNLNSEIFDKGIAHGLAASAKYIAVATPGESYKEHVAKLFNSIQNGYAPSPS